MSENDREASSAAQWPCLPTPAASREIDRLGGVLRVGIEKGGCCGTTYVFSLHRHSGDLEFQDDSGLTLCVSPDAAVFLSGARLDYSGKITPPRFRVLSNPNTTERCACNRSFGQPFPGKATPQCRAYQPMPWDQR